MPWGNDDNGGSPWGNGTGRNNNGGGPRRPHGNNEGIDDLVSKKVKEIWPDGFNFNATGGILLLVVVILLWLVSGFYRVLPDEQGIVLRFGSFVERTGPGLNYHLPYPIESVYTPKVTIVNETQVGYIKTDMERVIDQPQESLMLTGDENIVDIDFTIFWVIKDAANYLFNVQNPVGTIKAVAESSMREVIGRRKLQPILTTERNEIEIAVQEIMQQALESYTAGIEIQKVQMDKVDPPSQVIDAFRDVQAAKADQERLQNEADSYSNKVIPEARGEAQKIIQAAEAYKSQIVSEAEGMADRFSDVYEEYIKAPDVTRQRIYLETMENLLKGREKIIIDSQGKQGVVPYLPLDTLKK